MRIEGNAQASAPSVRPAEAVTGVREVKPEPRSQAGAGQTQTQTEAPDRERLDQVVEKMNEAARIFNPALKFQIATDKSIVIQVVDTESGEVIKQIPPGKLVDAFHRVEQTLGLLMDQRV